MLFKRTKFLRYLILFVGTLVFIDLIRFPLFGYDHVSKIHEDGDKDFADEDSKTAFQDRYNWTEFIPPPELYDARSSVAYFEIKDLQRITRLPRTTTWMQLQNQSSSYNSSLNPIHLITQWYHEINHRRRRELLAVLQMNLLNDAITFIHFVQYSNECTIFEDVKLDPNFPVSRLKSKLVISYQTEVNHTERLTVSKAFRYANRVISIGYAVLLNLDIFFDQSLTFLRRMPLVDRSTIFYLSRYEVDPTISKLNALCSVEGYVGSHDALIFRPPLSLSVVDQFPFELGTWHVEVKIIADLTLANYTVRNVCKSIRCWHLHSSQIRHRMMPSKKYIPDNLLHLYMRPPESLSAAPYLYMELLVFLPWFVLMFLQSV